MFSSAYQPAVEKRSRFWPQYLSVIFQVFDITVLSGFVLRPFLVFGTSLRLAVY